MGDGFRLSRTRGVLSEKEGRAASAFSHAGGGNCYLHWKSALNVSTEINGFYIPNCPEDLKGKALDLLGKLKSTG
jgi:hypothetical protein